MTLELKSGHYFGVLSRGETPFGYLYTWYDGHHHQFAIGPLCFIWGIG